MAESAEVLALPAEGGPAPPWWLQPGKLWSLWEMLGAFARYFYSLGADMEGRRIELKRWAEEESERPEPSYASHADEYMSPWFLPFLKQELEFAQSAGTYVSIPLTMKKLARVQELVGLLENEITAPTPDRIRQAFEDLHERFQDELDTQHFLFVPAHLAPYYMTKLPFGEEVADRFSSAAIDIDEAGRCLALGRSTACVLHLMRVLEVGLTTLARAVSADADRPGWEKIINNIRGKINDMNAASHGADWRRLKDAYSDAAAHLLVAKDAWRNHAMHKPVQYSEDRAKDIYASVRGFMQSIAAELRESP